MSPDDIIGFWGEENLKRWSASAFRTVEIPARSKAFLTDVGMPCNEDWTLRFDAEADCLPALQAKPKYRRIGFDDFVPLCLDEGHAGRVVAVEADNGDAVRFINSSVEQFGYFLVFYQQYRKSARALSEDEVDRVIESIDRNMHEYDPQAFDDPNNWWPVIIEQMKQGLL